MPVRNLFIIRTALMTGVFLFAGVAYFGPRFGLEPRLNLVDSLDTLRYVSLAFIAVAVIGATAFRIRMEALPAAQQATPLIVGWALGEAAALFGTVLYMGGSGVASLALGLMSFVFTLVVLPIPRPRR